jgi:hypothetical protein
MAVQGTERGDDRMLARRAARWVRWNTSVWPMVTPALFSLLGVTVLVLAVVTPQQGWWLVVKLALLGVLAAVVAWDIIPDGSFDMFDAWVSDGLSPQQRAAGWALLAYLEKGDLEPLRAERAENGAATDRLLGALAAHGRGSLREAAAAAAARLGATG